MTDDCIFCRIAAGSIPATIVHEDDHVVAFEDLNPQAPTHVLVIPRKHVPTIDDLTSEDDALVGRIVGAARSIARARGVVEDGYRLVWNVGAGAGQTVFHIHLHLLAGRHLKWPPG